jgi:hypothetical protein
VRRPPFHAGVRDVPGPAEVSFIFCGGSLEAFNRVGGAHRWGQGGRVDRVGGGKSAVLLLFVCVVEHFAVVSGVICSILGPSGLVGAMN